jgi:hypothetical protein
MRSSPASTGVVAGESSGPIWADRTSGAITLHASRVHAMVRHMEDGYTKLGTVLADRRHEDSEGDGVIVVSRFKGTPTTALSSATTLAGETCT